MSSWSRKFHKPVSPLKGKPIETLAQARAFILALPKGMAERNEWQFAVGQLLACAQDGTCYAARDALVNALFLNLMLDLDREEID